MYIFYELKKLFQSFVKNFSINVPCSSILDQERNLKFKNFHDRDFRNTLYPQPSSLKIKKKKNPQLLKFHPWKEKEKRKKAFPSDRGSTLLGKWLDLLSLFSRWYKNAFHYFYRLETRERERENIRGKRRRYEEKFLCSRAQKSGGGRGNVGIGPRFAQLGGGNKGETYVYVRWPR